jgi:hypothetical protein
MEARPPSRLRHESPQTLNEHDRQMTILTIIGLDRRLTVRKQQQLLLLGPRSQSASRPLSTPSSTTLGGSLKNSRATQLVSPRFGLKILVLKKQVELVKAIGVASIANFIVRRFLTCQKSVSNWVRPRGPLLNMLCLLT